MCLKGDRYQLTLLCTHSQLLRGTCSWQRLSRHDLALKNLSVSILVPFSCHLKRFHPQSCFSYKIPQASCIMPDRNFTPPSLFLICTDTFSDMPLTKLFSSIFAQQLQNTARLSIFFLTPFRSQVRKKSHYLKVLYIKGAVMRSNHFLRLLLLLYQRTKVPPCHIRF